MTRLAMVIFSVVATTLAGMGVVAVLVMGLVTAKAIVTAAVLGLILAIPATWGIARALA